MTEGCVHTRRLTYPAQLTCQHLQCLVSVSLSRVHLASASTPHLAEAFELLMPRSKQPSPILRSRRHSSFRLKPYWEDMVPHSVAQSMPALPDILRTPPVRQPLKPSFMFAQGLHPNQLLPPRRVQKLGAQACVQQRVDPVDCHLSVRSSPEDARASQRLCDSQYTSLLGHLLCVAVLACATQVSGSCTFSDGDIRARSLLRSALLQYGLKFSNLSDAMSAAESTHCSAISLDPLTNPSTTHVPKDHLHHARFPMSFDRVHAPTCPLRLETTSAYRGQARSTISAAFSAAEARFILGFRKRHRTFSGASTRPP